ncbi:MAG: fimbrillin family protein [Muribaculaceae bacterium]|nr:fimbrillin family protein [Muribaculaceae bacterium]MDE6703317.1 fimbrillin family protein [Muribaculaceae bacterium]
MRHNIVQIIMFIICCMWCITSCSSDSSDELAVNNRSEMSFDIANESRASTTLIDEFTVYGDRKFKSNDEPAVIFDKTQVVNKDGVWFYNNIQHWYPSHEHSFVAISPSSALESDANPQYSASVLSFTYSLPTYSGKEMKDRQDKNELNDIVAATHRRLYKTADNINTISLSFVHLLSMINFAPCFEDKNLKEDKFLQFHKLELIGFKHKMKVTIAPAPLLSNQLTYDNVIELADREGEDFMTITFEEPKTVNNGERINLFDESDAIIMLPQTFSNNPEAKVRFTYTLSSDPDNMRQGTISLKDITWEQGKTYTYNFTIDKIGLNLGTTTIKAWDSKSIPDIEWKVE